MVLPGSTVPASRRPEPGELACYATGLRRSYGMSGTDGFVLDYARCGTDRASGATRAMECEGCFFVRQEWPGCYCMLTLYTAAICGSWYAATHRAMAQYTSSIAQYRILIISQYRSIVQSRYSTTQASG
eukprot:2755334-Rhodomonas_salina.3